MLNSTHGLYCHRVVREYWYPAPAFEVITVKLHSSLLNKAVPLLFAIARVRTAS